MTVETLVPICGFEHGWCVRTPRCSCWQMPLKCKYYRYNHPSFPTITLNKLGELCVKEAMRYDVRYATRQEYDECEHGIIKVEETGYCDTCKMATGFWDTNVKLYVCSNRCRTKLYRKLEDASND